jgi:hypothetical protein
MWPARRPHHRQGSNETPIRARTQRRSLVGVVAALMLIGAVTQACSGNPNPNSNSNSSSSDPGKTAFRIGTVAWASSILSLRHI